MSRHRKSTGFLSRPRSSVGMADDGEEFYDDTMAVTDLAVDESLSVDQPLALSVPLPASDEARESSASKSASAPEANSEDEADSEAAAEAPAAESPAVASAVAPTAVEQPRSTSPYISMGYAPQPQRSVEYPPSTAPTAPVLPAVSEPAALSEPTPASDPTLAPESAAAPEQALASAPEWIAPGETPAPPQPPAAPEPQSPLLPTPMLPAPTFAFVPPSIEPVPSPVPGAANPQPVANAVAPEPAPMAYQPPAPLIAAAAAAADYTVAVEVDGSAVPAVAPETGLAASVVDLTSGHGQPRRYEPPDSVRAPLAAPDVDAAGTLAPTPAAPTPGASETVAPETELLAPIPYTPVIAPDRRTRRSEERSSRRRRRGLIISGGIVVTALVAAVGVRLATHQRSTGPVAGDGAVAVHQTTALMMLVGSNGDMVAGALISADPASGLSHVVLVPSKVIVSIPGHGSQQLARATEFDRATVPMAAVSDLFGVRVDGSWVVDAAALATLIDRTGGITVDLVDTDVHGTSGGRDVVLVPAGSHVLLNGSQAVAYASYLASQEDEIARLVRFQQVLDALVNTLPDNATDVTDRVSALGAGTVFGGTKGAVGVALAAFHKSSVASTVTEEPMPVRSIDSGGAEPIYGVDTDKMRELVGRDFAGSTLKRRAGGLDRVLVENGVGTPGLGECVRNQLVAAGFDFKGSSNLPGFTFRDKPSLVLIYDSQPANIEAGQAVAAALKLPTSAVQVSSEPQNLADIVIVLGKDYACS